MRKFETIIFLFPFGAFLVIYFAFDFNGLYGQDAHEYYRFSNELISCIQTGSSPGPFFWPLGYPGVGAIAGSFFGDALLPLQLLTTVSMSLSGYFVFKTLTLRYERIQSFYLVLIIILSSAYMFRSGFIVMSDMMTVACISAFFYYSGLYKLKARPAHIPVLGFLFMMAIMTRYASFVVLIVPALFIAYEIFKNKHWFWILPGLLVGAIVAAPHFFLRYEAGTDFLSHNWLTHWSVKNFWSREFEGFSGDHTHLVPNFLFSLKCLVHPGFLSVLPICWIFVRKIKVPKIHLLTTILYLCFLAGIPMQNTRFQLLAIPSVALLIAPVFSYAYERFYRYFKFFLLSSIVLNLILIPFAFDKLISLNQQERAIARKLSLIDDKKLYSFSIDIAMKSYTDKEWLSMYSDNVIQPDTTALVLFNEKLLAKQWKNTTVMHNWKRFKTEGIQLKDSLSGGWVLYEFTK